MLRIRLNELSTTDRDRLRGEVAATLLHEFVRIPYVEHRSGALRQTPLTRATRAGVEAYLAGVWDDTLALEISSSTLTEHLIDLLLRFHEANLPGRPDLRRRARPGRERAPQLVASLQRRLVAYVLDGAHPDFGAQPPDGSWLQGDLPRWEQMATATTQLAQALTAAQTALEDAPAFNTMALPIVGARVLPAAPRAEHAYTAPLPRPLDMTPQRDMSGHDRAIFVQLREQLLQALASAASNYGLAFSPEDPAGLLEGLRVRDAVDVGDLRLAEGILALSARVVGEGRASLDDYRQALMLYLLFHRGRFAQG